MGFSLFFKKLLIRTGIARFLPGVQRLTEGGGDFLHYLSDRLLAALLFYGVSLTAQAYAAPADALMPIEQAVGNLLRVTMAVVSPACQHAPDVAVHHRMRQPERNTGDGRGGVWAHAR